MLRKKMLLAALTLAFLCCLGAAAYASAGDGPPLIPAILAGTVKATDGDSLSSGTVKAYINDELKGTCEIEDGTYYLLVQGTVADIQQPVLFKVEIDGVEYPAVSSPAQVLWESELISGLGGFPDVNLTVDYQPQQLVQVSVLPTSVSLAVPQTRQLSVTTVPADASVSYKSSRTSVATVSASGLITAVSPGTATITVTAAKTGMTSGTAKVDVTVTASSLPVVTISGVPGTVTLKPGETKQLSISTDPPDARVTYQSSKTSVAKVSATGLITAVAQGTATITVKATKTGYTEDTATITVIVSNEPAVVITGVPGSATLKPGEKMQLAVTTVPSDSTVTFQSSNSGVATVSGTGLITAVSKGTAVITVTASRTGYTTASVELQLTVAEAVTAPLFRDLGRHWAEQVIYDLVGAGIISGYPDQTFLPDGKITRAECAVIISKALKLEAGDDTVLARFSDNSTIPGWARPALAAVVKAGLLNGYPVPGGGTALKASNYITRQEIAVIIGNILTQRFGSQAVGGGLTFVDRDELAQWAKAGIEITTHYGIVQGYPDQTFRGANLVTRAECAVMFSNLLKLL